MSEMFGCGIQILNSFSIESQVVSGEDNGETTIEVDTSGTFGAGHTDLHEWTKS